MSIGAGYSGILSHFEDQAIITIAAGTTCACLGDERSLREFLVADEAASQLRRAGHVVFSLLVNDSFDPLNVRQLRLAVDKDEAQIERYRHWCGQPIASLPDPWGCHPSYAAHFEAALLERLHRLDCHPTLVSTADLYARGLYAPYIRTVLERHDEIRALLQERCHGYNPEKLLWVVCPHCATMDQTRVERIAQQTAHVRCDRCDHSAALPFDQVRGKLNWKLDCAVRWQLLGIDVEPFGKDYLDPLAGSYVIARTFSQEILGGKPAHALPYGQVKIDRYCSYKLLEALPAGALRALFVDRPAADIHLTRALALTAASRYSVAPHLTYLDFIKQLLPVWMLAPDRLTAAQRDLVSQGIAFSRYFLDSPVGLRLPNRATIQEEEPAILEAARALLSRVLQLRTDPVLSMEDFDALLHGNLPLPGEQKRRVMHRVRVITGQERGLPVQRLLFLLPVNYLQLLVDLLDLHLEAVGVRPREKTVLVTV